MKQFCLSNVAAEFVDAPALVVVAENIDWHEWVWEVCLDIPDQLMEIVSREFELEHFKIEDQCETVVPVVPGKFADDLSIPDHFAEQECFAKLIADRPQFFGKFKTLRLIQCVLRLLEKAGRVVLGWDKFKGKRVVPKFSILVNNVENIEFDSRPRPCSARNGQYRTSSF